MSVRERYTAQGTRFVISDADLIDRSRGIKAVLFDWDGVFNDGFKDLDGGSPFSEVDSMGVNLLRFAVWSRNGEVLPVAAIITGQHNTFAERFAERERFHGVYMGFTNKPDAFDALLNEHGLKPEQVAFVFDDVLDVPVAQRCGLRVLIGHQATQEFQRNAVSRKAADVIVPSGNGRHPLREACEMLMALWGCWDDVVEHRVNYDATYQRYLAARNAVQPKVVRNDR